jgi:hypothetical protein
MKEGMDSEMQALVGGLDLSLVVLRVFHLHSSHFTALDGLFTFFQGQPLADKTVRIHLLTMRSLNPLEAEWKPVLHHALLSPRLTAHASNITTIICAEIT